MSLSLPARRLVQTARATTNPSLHLHYLLPATQTRRLSWFTWGQRRKDPLSKELEKRQAKSKAKAKGQAPADEKPAPTETTPEMSAREAEKAMARQMYLQGQKRTSGTSLFDEEVETAAKKAKSAEQQDAEDRAAAMQMTKVKEHMQRALDPDPRWRVRWLRRKVAQMVRSNGHLTREERIRLAERELTHQSENLPTSVKKLMHLSRQIAGKTVEDALVQMRFSKKKMAPELAYILEEARDEAIVSRGMGLGGQNADGRAKKIQTKDGKWIEVNDPTRLYIEQAWVGKGPYRGQRIQYHARGRMSVMWRPSTHIGLVLKEEKTRIRQYEEKKAKEAKAKPWVHLPNRPITAQRQYYSW